MPGMLRSATGRCLFVMRPCIVEMTQSIMHANSNEFEYFDQSGVRLAGSMLMQRRCVGRQRRWQAEALAGGGVGRPRRWQAEALCWAEALVGRGSTAALIGTAFTDCASTLVIAYAFD